MGCVPASHQPLLLLAQSQHSRALSHVDCRCQAQAGPPNGCEASGGGEAVGADLQ